MQHAQAAWRRWTPYLALAVMFFALAGFSISSVVDGMVVVVCAIICWLIETRLQGPTRSYCRLAFGSVLLLVFLMFTSWHGERRLAGVTWAGVTAIAAFVTAFYERTAKPN